MEQQLTDTDNLTNNDTNITIQAIRKKTRTVISTLLNPIKVIPNEKGLPRDWQGLAELCEISGEKIPNIQNDSDPTNKILHLWHEKDKDNSTISKLLQFLGELDRFDIIDDITQLIEEDVAFHKRYPNDINTKPDLDADQYILTIDDVTNLNEGLELQTYDAFVLFAEDDIDFATELIQTMEKQYNLKFCVKDRDLVGGGFEHDSIIKLISERCNRLIVIISNAFLSSSANKFFYGFAQAIAIEQRQRKIIPCVYKTVDKLPPEFSCYFMLDYKRSGKLWNFWDRLNDSIKTPKVNKEQSKNAVNRSVSQYIHAPPKPKPSIHHESSLRPLNQVKFNSMVNLNSYDADKILPDESLTASTSANSLGGCPEAVKKNKSKMNWLKKILHKNNEVKNNKTNEVEVEKEKKKFWSRHNKRKVALATN